MSTKDDALRSKLEAVHQRLIEAYGEPERRDSRRPLDQLIGTILSQNTNDINRDRAYKRLRERFPTWADVRDAPLEEVKEAIRPAGLANQKGPRIVKALRQITDEFGELSIDFLSDMPVEEAREWLTDLEGVGPKTAAIVLLFSLGLPAFPVDTHVHRVTRRLGLIEDKTSAAKAHDRLEDLVPPEWYYPFHINLIRHGRQVCQARSPKCKVCVLSEFCDYYAREYPDS